MFSALLSNMEDKFEGAVFKNTNFSEILAPNFAKQSSAELHFQRV